MTEATLGHSASELSCVTAREMFASKRVHVAGSVAAQLRLNEIRDALVQRAEVWTRCSLLHSMQVKLSSSLRAICAQNTVISANVRHFPLQCAALVEWLLSL